MPTYQYRCQECDGTFEVIQTMADKPLKQVPSTNGPCGGKCKAPVERVFTPPNINLRQGKVERITDEAGGETVKHWDGRQDVTVRPAPVQAGVTVPHPQ